MKIGSLFTGTAGLDMATEAVFGGGVAWTADNDPAASTVIAARLPTVPNHGDITKIDWSAVEPVDIVTGGFPCQDVSQAGRRVGMRFGTRSGLWSQMAEAVDQLRPKIMIAENVRGVLHSAADGDVEPCPGCMGDGTDRPVRALGAVLADLADIGYDARWYGLYASDVGAPHRRFRVFIVATDSRRETVPQRPRSCSREPAGVGWRRPDHRHGQTSRSLTLLPTPTATDSKASGGSNAQNVTLTDATVRTRATFGKYAEAVTRWETITGTPAPVPTVDGRLSPIFVEWMLGLPRGWVTDLDLPRSKQLRVLGAAVVPRQATAALAHMA